VLPTRWRVVDRWPSPRALLALPPPSDDGGWELRGSSRNRALGVGSTNARPSWPSPLHWRHGPARAARSRVRRSGRALRPSRSSSTICGLLSWGCQSPPLHRHRCLVSTPGGPLPRRACRPVRSRGNSPCDAEPPSARSCHAPDSFRPCRSSRLRRLAPPGTCQVCCTLKPILGFAKLRVVGACWLRLVSTGRDQSRESLHRLTRSPKGARLGRCRSTHPVLFRRRAVGNHLDEAGWRHPPTVPIGAPPFGAFPSLTAASRQPPLVSALRSSTSNPKKPNPSETSIV
jgi:hypothetical protein